MKKYPATNATVRDNFRNARLLIIDDNADHRFLIQKALQQSMPEVNVTLVANEDEAMAYLNQCQAGDREIPRLVLLDLYLPDRQSGWRLLDYIRDSSTAISKIPVVLFSNSDHRDDVTGSYQRGCSSYVVKPTLVSEWQLYFDLIRSYWWETVTLPKTSFMSF